MCTTSSLVVLIAGSTVVNPESGESMGAEILDPVLLPNPTTGPLYIEFNNLSTGSAILQVFNTQGSLVLERIFDMKAVKEVASIELDQLPSGLYIVKLKDASGKVFLYKIEKI
jgi:hypothetical protein